MVRATLDEGSKSNEIEQSYWTRVINWTHALQTRVQNQKKWQIDTKPTWNHLRKKNWLKAKKEKELKRRAHDVKNQDASYRVQLKDSICFK
jgi:hypothetical protein